MAEEVGRVSLGLEIDDSPIQAQEPKIQKAAERVGSNSGKSLLGGLSDKLKSGGKSITSVFSSQGASAASGFVGKLLKGIGGAAGKIGSVFKTVVGGAISGAVAIVGAAIGAAFKTADIGDEIDKMSQKIGISRQAYQEWAHVMEHCGTDISVLQTGMKTLSSSVQNESDALKKLGIDTKEALGMSTEDLFNTVVSKLQDMEAGTERTAIASKLLGRSATELGAVLNMSSADMEAMKQNLHEMGAVMSDQAVLDSAAMKDALTDLKAAFSGITTTLGAAVIPAITSFINGAVIPAAKVIAQFAAKIAQALSMIGGFVGAVLGISGAAGKSSGALGLLGKSGTAAVDGIADSTADAINGISGVGSAAGKSAGKAKKAAQDLKRTLEGFDQITKVKEDSSSGGGGGGGGGGAGVGALDTVEFGNSLLDVESKTTKLSDKLQKIADKIRKKLQALVKYLTGWYNRYIGPTIKSIRETWDTCSKNIKDGYEKYMKPTFDRLKQLWDRTIETNIKPAMETLGRVIQKLWDKVLRPLFIWISENIMPALAPIVEFLGGALIGAIGAVATGIDLLLQGVEWLIDQIQPLIDWIKSLVEWFGKMPEDVSTKVSLVKDALFDKVKSAWESIKDKTAEIKAYVQEFEDKIKDKWLAFKAKMQTWSDELKDKAMAFKAKMQTWSDNLKDKTLAFKAKLTTWADALADKAINFKAKLASWLDNIKSNDKTLGGFKSKLVSALDAIDVKTLGGFKAKITSFVDSIKNKVLGFTAKITGYKKDGGVYSGGSWHKIQQYASGGLPSHGQMFVAREHGPELVGTLGGHTAVMNNDQIVSSVSAGVAKAISGVKFYSAQHYTPRTSAVENHEIRQAASLEAMARQAAAASSGGGAAEAVRILKEILVILNEIMDQPIYLDGRDIRKRIVDLINAQTQATGRCEIVT